MRTILYMVLATTFVGAACQSANGLTRSCPGSKPQTVTYLVDGDCGGVGVITVAVSSPDSCDLAVDGPTSVGLPATGFFATTTGTNPYSLLQGNWLLETAPTGTNECIPGLDCTGGAAASNGSLTLNCATWQCETSGEDQETSRKSGPPCVAHLTVYDGDAAAYNSTPDSSTSSKGDAGGDATATTPSSDGGAG